MSHFIETMAYAGETPWHRLGTHLGDENVDGATMQKAAGLDFRVQKAAIFVKRPDGSLIEVEDVHAMVRDDRFEPFAAVTVGNRYEIFQNAGFFEFGDRLRTAAGRGLKWHTAGSLKGGRVVWALAQMAGSIDVQRRNGRIDQSAPFLLLSNSFDGSSAIRIMNTSIRVVCWNTLSAALKGNNCHSIRHTASASAQLTEAARALGYATEYFTEYAETAQTLADTPMSRENFGTFAAQLLTGLDDPKEALEKVAAADGRSETRLNNQFDALETLFHRGKGNTGADRFDALNAVTEYIDHQRGRLSSARSSRAAQLAGIDKALDSATFGSGAEMKARALNLLVK